MRRTNSFFHLPPTGREGGRALSGIAEAAAAGDGKKRKGNVIFAGESADGGRAREWSDFKSKLRGRGLQKVAEGKI